MGPYDGNSVIDPESAVSIGAWSLLADLRQILCGRLVAQTRKLGNLEPLLIKELISDSAKHWAGLSTEDKFQKERLVEYLNREADLTVGLETDHDWASLFERLIVPYVISVTDDFKVHPWFPDQTFLSVYYREFDHGSNGARPTIPLFLTEKTISQLRPTPGTYQDLLRVATTLPDARVRFASGMRALQSKLVGDYDRVLTQESRDIDRLVGNGSALMYGIEDKSWPPLGLICFSSPIIGLYHELLLPADVKEILPRPQFRRSIFICRAVLGQLDQACLDELIESSSVYTRAEGPPVSHIAIEETEVGTVDLLVCSTCEGSGTNARCVFGDIDTWLNPMLGTFLSGLKQIAARAELEPLKKYAATLSHVLHTPIATIATSFFYYLEKIAPEDAELKAALEKLGASLFALYQITESTSRNFQFERQGDSDSLKSAWPVQAGGTSTDLVEIVRELEFTPFFESLFQMGIELRPQVGGTQTLVSGYKGDWYVIFYTLLKNAFTGASRWKVEQDSQASVAVTLNLLYPDDESGTFSLEFRNPSPRLDPALLVAMGQCLTSKLARIPTEIYRKNPSGGFGVGLGIVGDIIKANGFTATIEQDASTLEVILRINDVPVRNT